MNHVEHFFQIFFASRVINLYLLEPAGNCWLGLFANVVFQPQCFKNRTMILILKSARLFLYVSFSPAFFLF